MNKAEFKKLCIGSAVMWKGLGTTPKGTIMYIVEAKPVEAITRTKPWAGQLLVVGKIDTVPFRLSDIALVKKTFYELVKDCNLLNCPFCNGSVRVWKGRSTVSIGCNGCGVAVSKPTLVTAASVWNTRVTH